MEMTLKTKDKVGEAQDDGTIAQKLTFVAGTGNDKITFSMKVVALPSEWIWTRKYDVTLPTPADLVAAPQQRQQTMEETIGQQ